MNESTDAPQGAASVAPASTSATEHKPAAAGKPRFALFVATACGLGYLPKAPGTWGSLAGCIVAIVSVLPWLPILSRRDAWLGNLLFPSAQSLFWRTPWPYLIPLLVIAALGVWSASRVESVTGIKDPQHVVIDEVSGQQLTFVLGMAPLFLSGTTNSDFVGYGFLFARELLHWKYLLLGFILFRAFDIWKPFPARQAESLPGGWGIMADDWIAGVYAAIGLWIARAMGL